VIRGRMSPPPTTQPLGGIHYLVINHDVVRMPSPSAIDPQCRAAKRERLTGLTTFVARSASAARALAIRQAASSFDRLRQLQGG